MKAIRCKCGSIYPNDMAECPSCQRSTEDNLGYSVTTSRSLNINKSDPKKWKPVEVTPYNPNLTLCSACAAQISTHAESCPKCGHPTGVHVCPKCNSINTKVISGASKAASIFMWGAFAANKVKSTYECKDCGQKF